MNRKIDKDWTDALRESVEGAELTPSAGGWERLSADLRPHRVAWWPYAVSAAACAAACAVLLFRSPADSRIDVAPSPRTAEAVAEALLPEVNAADTGADMLAEAAAAPAPAEAEPAPWRHISAVPAPSTQAAAPLEAEAGELPAEPEVSAPQPAAAPVAESETAPETAGGADAPRHGAAAPQRPAPRAEDFGFEDPWPAETRKPRRHVTVTVSAGGAFGSHPGQNYIAKSYATKADDSVVDLSDVIRHNSPFQASLGVKLPLTDRLGLGSGLEYLSLTSSAGPASQELQWIGVPLSVDCRVADWGQSELYLNAGATGQKCLSASLLGIQYNEPFQLAANLGAEYRISLFGPVDLSLMPEFAYYFTQTVLPTYRSGHPLTFNLCAGLSVRL